MLSQLERGMAGGQRHCYGRVGGTYGRGLRTGTNRDGEPNRGSERREEATAMSVERVETYGAALRR